MSSILSFHQNVSFLQSLVVEEGPSPHGTGNHRLRSEGQSSNAARNYNIRRCLRHLQGLMLNEDFTLPPMSVDGDDDRCANYSAGDSISRTTPEEKLSSTELTYDQVTKDLVTLLTVDFDIIGDNSITQMFQESIQPRLFDVLEKAPHLGPMQLHRLLNHVMTLLQRDSQMEGMTSENGRDLECVLQQHLDLFNRHVTQHEHLRLILINDYDLFVALHIVLFFQQKQSVSSLPSMQLAVLINTLIEYWVFHCFKCDDPPHGEGDCPGDDGPKDIHIWLQRQFLQQQQSHLSPEMLQQVVDDYLSRVEHYGMHLIESTLQMLEESTASLIGETVAGGTIFQEEGCYNSNSPPSTGCRYQDDDDDHEVVVLQYAALATNFLVAIQKSTISLVTDVFAISRSLWREYVNFVVRGMSASSGHRSLESQETCSDTMNFPETTQSETDVLDLSMVATDTLWRLVQYHYPCNHTNTGGLSSSKNNDLPMITATILCLMKHSSHFWNQDTIDWISHQLQYTFPGTTSLGKEFRLSMQAIILSCAYFPSSNSENYQKQSMESLMKLVLGDNEEVDDSASMKSNFDPWKGWVVGQLSNPSCEVAHGDQVHKT